MQQLLTEHQLYWLLSIAIAINTGSAFKDLTDQEGKVTEHGGITLES